jgi:type IX secretion system PorP/SprF family membrane protein
MSIQQELKMSLTESGETKKFRRGGKGILLGLLLLNYFLLTQPLLAQDPHFSQYYAAPLYLNPALAGAERDIAFSLNHRSQWRSLGFPQNTSQFSVIGALPKQSRSRIPRYCLGLSAFSDVAGEQGSYVSTGASASFAYNIPLNQLGSQSVSLGVQAGLTQKSLNAGQLQWGSQFDPAMGYNPDRYPTAGQDVYQALYPVLSTGIVWFFNPKKSRLISDFSAYSGLSVANLNRPNESFFSDVPVRLPVLIKMHGGAEVPLSSFLTLAPAWLLMHQNGRMQMNLGTYLTYHSDGQLQGSRSQRGRKYVAQHRAPQTTGMRISVGGWYRFGDSVIASIGVSQQRFTIGFSYDFNVSTLRQYTGGNGAYELSLTYRLLRSQSLKRFSIPMM